MGGVSIPDSNARSQDAVHQFSVSLSEGMAAHFCRPEQHDEIMLLLLELFCCCCDVYSHSQCHMKAKEFVAVSSLYLSPIDGYRSGGSFLKSAIISYVFLMLRRRRSFSSL